MYPILTTHHESTVTVSIGLVGNNSFGGFFLKNFCKQNTVKLLKLRTPETYAVITLKFEQGGFTIYRVMHPNDADRMANSVDPDQTAPLGAVWSGSTLFAQAFLSENLGSLWYAN